MKKLKIFGVPWHLGHQYELAKLPFLEWHWLKQYKRDYSTKVRGDFMVNWVPYYEPGKYDLAMLHVDQQISDPEIYRTGKGFVYRSLNEIIQDVPKIVINHGTPYWPEKFESDYIIEFMKRITKNNYMVVNSERAAEMWGRGTPIIHGLDPAEWLDLPKEARSVTMISPGGCPKYYDRALLAAVQEQLADKDLNHTHITVDFVAKDWDDYRQFLGRSLVYFNPTKESPMPRSRTEALLSGCCVVTTPTHDIDKYIKNGYNGFLVKRNPKAIADLIEWLLNDYETAIKVGQRGREMAKKQFHIDRYQKDWYEFIKASILDWHIKKDNSEKYNNYSKYFEENKL